MTRSRSRRRNGWRGSLALAVMTAAAAACLAGCAPRDTGQSVRGSQSRPDASTPASNIPDAARSPTGSPTAPITATDPCATRLHDLSGPLLHYYALNRRLPERLEELEALAGPDPAAAFDCPVSGQPYVYVPGGFPWGDKGFVILHDAEPSHAGFRWAVVVEDPQPGQPLVTRVVAVPEPLFLSRERAGNEDAAQD